MIHIIFLLQKGIKVLAGCSEYQRRISQLQADLEKVEEKNLRSRKEKEKKVRSLELKLRKHSEKEQQLKLQYENLMKEELHLVKTLQQVRDELPLCGFSFKNVC